MINKIIALLILLIVFSCGKKIKENDLNSNDSINERHNHKIPTFFFLHKGMTYEEVKEYLDLNSIKHTALLTPFWNEPVKNSLNNLYSFSLDRYKSNFNILNNYSNAKYVKVYDYRIEDIHFDELRLYFVDGEIYKLTYQKCFYDWKRLYQTSSISNNLRSELNEIYFNRQKINEMESKSLHLLTVALTKKYGPPNLNQGEDNSFVSDIDDNQFHPSWGALNNLNLNTITIQLGNSNSYYEEKDNNITSVKVEYSLYYYLTVDFATISLNKKIVLNKLMREKARKSKEEKEQNNLKVKEIEFLNKI